MADKLNYNQIIHNTLIICYDSGDFLGSVLSASSIQGSCNGESLVMYFLATIFHFMFFPVLPFYSLTGGDCHKSNHNTIKSVLKENGKTRAPSSLIETFSVAAKKPDSIEWAKTVLKKNPRRK